ncbi:hypothetical protein AOLI_G00292750 [Acnodon oligacanthus]
MPVILISQAINMGRNEHICTVAGTLLGQSGRLEQPSAFFTLAQTGITPTNIYCSSGNCSEEMEELELVCIQDLFLMIAEQCLDLIVLGSGGQHKEPHGVRQHASLLPQARVYSVEKNH